MLLALVETLLVTIIIAAKNVPPIDTVSLVFNIWFGLVTVAVVIVMKELLHDILFSDAIKAKLTMPAMPLCTTTIIKPSGGCVHNSIYHSAVIGIISKLNDNSEESTRQPEPIAVDAKSTQPETQSSCPGTPDSQADTEPETHVKMSKGLGAE